MPQSQAVLAQARAAALLAAARDSRFPAFLDADGGLEPAAHDFLGQAAADLAPDDFAGLAAADQAAMLHRFWAATAVRRAGSRDIRVIEARDATGAALGFDVIEIAGPDMPFLVDSVMGEITTQGLDVRAMIHPIVRTRRSLDGVRGADGPACVESLIQVQVSPVPAARKDALVGGLGAALDDVAVAVADFPAMKARMLACADALAGAATLALPADVTEAVAFLHWLAADNFIFLGARSYDYAASSEAAIRADKPVIEAEKNLGVLRDPLRSVLRRANEPLVLTPRLRAYLDEPTPLIVAKSNLRSRVHRRAVMDYVSVKRYDPSGAVVGEDRFVGLFTAEAYNRSVNDVPLLRRKVQAVLDAAGLTPGAHSDKKLRNILETFPRDELFQIEPDELRIIATAVAHLYDRPRPRLFVRRDRFDRFVSCLVFVPRDRYNSTVRERIGEALRAAWDGRLSAFYPEFSDQPLARVHYIIGLNPGDHPEPDEEALEAEIVAATRNWDDALEAAARRVPELAGAAAAWSAGFPASYREAFDASEALADLPDLLAVSGPALRVRAWRRTEDAPELLRAKLYRRGEPAPLSAIVPILESMGLWIATENPHRICGPDGAVVWIQDLEMRRADASVGFDGVEAAFEAACTAIWDGRAETDGFNRLILSLGVGWREAALIRALARWRQQSGLDPSQAVQEEACAAYPAITALILQAFAAKFDPATGGDAASREMDVAALFTDIEAALDGVPNLDADRALRRIAGAVKAAKRTNYFQTGADGAPKPWISIKFASREVAELPAPKPYREIFVWSPRVEGVHLRFGPVARGGLRWSDRRDDFRTEVLGLVKAQQVKNAVIVPVGSKGGFFPKQLPRGGAREAVQAEGVEAYKTFLRGLLDVTDNLSPDGSVTPPRDVVRWDGDDPYLVVAADKGTATFSDIANGVSAEYGHWLGDAFASGGSVGYDHKKMGITARGAWEAVKRHFREAGKDIQSEPFTVIGVGDMSGDVFGNGMLLSRQIRLLAAFDHRHIFLDPNPDPAASFAERARMFALPRSSWADYDASLISRGGGVFARDLKAVPLSDEVRALTGLTGAEATPSELMHALLKAPCELMWFGGIGTYVKAAAESHAAAGDKANDAIRVDAEELQAKVIGEGANLGMTQRGRIAAARAGVRLNTDAIDNSAGVDSSDHEVNIKILLNGLVRSGAMELEARDVLLASMTDDVAAHVLAHNYDQTLALTLQQATAQADLDAHQRFIERLESAGKLDRAVEFLPAPAEFRALAERRGALTRPELAVLTAYAKLQLCEEIVASDAPDDPWFARTLEHYFPDGCRPLAAAMQGHRLKREIIATVLSNRIVDLGGATLIDRVRESASADTASIVRAFAAAGEIFGLDSVIAEIKALDGKAPSDVQLDLLSEVVMVLRRQTFWLARRTGKTLPGVGDLVAAYRDGVQELAPRLHDIVSGFERSRLDERAAGLIAHGAPDALARRASALRPLISATDVIDLARSIDWPVLPAAMVYHRVGEAIGFDELRAEAGRVSTPDHWDRVATRRLIEDFMGEQALVARAVMQAADAAGGSLGAGRDAPDGTWAEACVEAWLTANEDVAGRAQGALAELSASGPWSYAKLAIANTQLRELAEVSRG